MSWLISFLLMILSFAIAARLAGFVVDSAIRLSNLLKIRMLIFGFVFVSISTSLPELSIAIFSGIRGESAISFGNLIGSDIVNLTLIFGLLALRGLKISEISLKEIIRSSSFVAIVSAILIIFSFLSWKLSIILFLLFLIYLKSIIEVFILPRATYFLFTPELIKNFFIFIFASIFVMFFAKIGVESAIELSKNLDLTKTFLGSTIIAIETSLPELFVAMSSIRRKKYEVSIGNIMGSNVVNSTLLLGITGLFSPMNLGMMEKLVCFFAILSSIVIIILASRGEMNKKDSLILLPIFFSFVAYLFYLQGLDFA